MLPQNIGKSGKDHLLIEWDNGHTSEFSMAELRQRCPCASCKGARERRPDSLENVEEISITDAEIIGRYALQFNFSDGHHEGIYAFNYLMQFCCCEECLKNREIAAI